MTLSIRWRVAAGFTTALAILAVVGVAAYRNATTTVADIAALRTERDKLDATREFTQRIAEVETGTRGFVITGIDAFLAPRDTALPYLPIVLRRLRQLESGDVWATGTLDSLERLVRARLSFDEQVIALRRAGRAAAAGTLIATGRGKLLMDAMRGRVFALESRVSTERARRTALLRASAEDTRLMAVLGGLLGIVALTAAGASIFSGLAARERAESRLRELAVELQDLYDYAPVGYHSLDANGVFVRMNRTELRWLGLTREEVVGKLRFSDLLPARSRPAFEDAFARFKAQGAVHDLEYDLIRKDGTILPVVLSATTVYDAAGHYLMSRGVCTDLTERRRAEAQVKTLRGLLPICAGCKKIRDDRGYWNQIERYLHEHSEAEFSHGLCPDCEAKLYSDLEGSPDARPRS
jgi:PAS domain S-box-containing protein